MKATRVLLLLAAVAAAAAPAGAQEGHPLKGTWYGQFGAGTERHDLTVAMDWDGREITGVIHPGPNQIPIESVVLDITPGVPATEDQDETEGIPPEFHVRIEVDAPNGAGGTDSFLFEGMIHNPVAGNRRIAGTWTCGDESGTFEIRRL